MSSILRIENGLYAMQSGSDGCKIVLGNAYGLPEMTDDDLCCLLLILNRLLDFKKEERKTE